MGNQVFSTQTPIITTQQSRAAMQMFADDILETKANPSELEEYIPERKKTLIQSAIRARESLSRICSHA
jgi:hypothetical protein